MSSGVFLDGSLPSKRPLRQCDSKTHNGSGLAEQEGGVQLSQSRWFCAMCYRKFVFKRK